jgi:hypothetical protein
VTAGKALAVAIVDRREIEPDTAAARCALECSPQSAQACGLPPLVPTGVRCKPAQHCIEVVCGSLTTTRVFMLRAELLGTLLISYCSRAGMAMPRHSDKGIRVEHERVVLLLGVRLDDPPHPEAPEGKISRVPEAVQSWAWIEPPGCRPS